MKTHIFFLVLVGTVLTQKNPYFATNRTTIVHLFEWQWKDIAKECEGFLKDKGYGGVQISPPNENLVIWLNNDRPWYERYQPVSYVLNTRSGNEEEFADMVKRCNAAGVRIYVDTVVNHMSAGDGTGTAGNPADRGNRVFPGVPYGTGDFHDECDINNYQDPSNVRNCALEHLADLNQSTDYVREKISEFMNHLVDLGVAGFRVDAAKHMWPADLQEIFGRLKDLNVDHGFPKNAKPFIFQEVIDLGGEAISKHEYTDFGTVLEFGYGASLGHVFQHQDKLSLLENWGPEWNLLEGPDAVAFIDNHDNQRTGGAGILTYKDPKPYKMAIAFMQAHPYGVTRVMSSYAFDNKDQGPPMDDGGNLISPTFNEDFSCNNGFVCEHRWRQIYGMVGFRDAVLDAEIEKWWTNFDQQIAFSRGDRGFIALTQEGDIDATIPTGLAAGTYCDVISGELVNGACTGESVVVKENGDVDVSLSASGDGVLAIHVNAKL